MRWMQPTRPEHHANASRSLFQNPWMLADSTQSTSTSYWPAFPDLSTFLSVPSISLERVPKSESSPHQPIKVVKPDWGHSTSTAASSCSETNLKATWLGHAVCHSRPPHRSNGTTSNTCSFSYPRVSSSSSRVSLQAQMMSRPASCSTPSSQTAPALLRGWVFDVACLLPAPSRNYQNSNSWSTPIISALSVPGALIPSVNIRILIAMTTSISPRCNKYMNCAARVSISSSR
jgi:hypothetical protein